MAAVRRPFVPDPAARRRFQQRLLGWYARHRRDLPWRRTSDPYHILVSEIMLQQTQVDRVVPKYHEFLARYPTLESLARARTADVKRVWYPLGYNARPVNLQGIARETLARYEGRLPDEAGALLSMRGIGRYTAGAILSFAYGRDAALVDTNVRRVLTRVFLGPRRARLLRGQKAIWALAEALIPASRTYDYNQALMDFGATWCTARAPRCAGCPMTAFCATAPPPGERTDGGGALRRVDSTGRRAARNGQARGPARPVQGPGRRALR
jgi:A/G-specific adenine glycosylase